MGDGSSIRVEGLALDRNMDRSSKASKACRWEDERVGTGVSYLPIASIFSVKQEAKSWAESEQGGGSIRGLRREEKVWNSCLGDWKN